MRQDIGIPGLYDRERIAVIILRNMETAFRNAANQIANGTSDPYSPTPASDSTVQTSQTLSEQVDLRKRPLVLSTQEAAKTLGISKPTLYLLARSGKLRCIHVGKAIRISEQAIIDYIRSAEQESQTW